MAKWNEIYEDIVDFYFWEPQHLGKIKNPKTKHKTYEGVMENISKMEVSLNHQMELFFTLAPKKFLSDFFSLAFATNLSDDFVYYPDSFGEYIEKLGDYTQPDFVFEGKKNIIAVETKIDAKSSLDQYLKYQYLGLNYQRETGTKKKFWLLYIGKKSVNLLWKEGFTSFSEVKEAFRDMEFPEVSKKGNVAIEKDKDDLLVQSKQTTLGYVKYSQLFNFVKKTMHSITVTAVSETYLKLLQGLADELEARKLVFS